MNNKQQLIVLQGLPASGKSTFARMWVNEKSTRRVRVNRDDIRRMLGTYWVPKREDLVTTIEEDIIISSLYEGYNVVVDATNLKGVNRFENLLKNYGMEKAIEIKPVTFFDVSVEECIRRDLLRDESEKVGEKVIRRFAKKYKHIIK